MDRLRARRPVALAALAAALVFALAWWRPWRAPAPAPRLVPRPTVAASAAPTITRAPQRIALPTARPPGATPVAVATPPLAATPVGGSAASVLYYLGLSEGFTGIVAVNADGTGRRLIAPGIYDTLAVSPDGSRFAAVGSLPDGSERQLAIFAADGRALARYPLGRNAGGPPSWSPSGKYLLTSFVPVAPAASRWETWVYGDGGARQIAPPANADDPIPYGWTRDDRLAYLIGEDRAQVHSRTLLTTDATGGDPQRHYEGSFVALGWSGDGADFYALNYDSLGTPDAALTQLIAIELPWGTVRRLAGADELAARALGAPNVPDSYRFAFAQLAPDGTILALGLDRRSRAATPDPRAPQGAEAIVFLRTYGQIAGVATLPPGARRGPGAWSADGSRFALLVEGERGGDGLLLAFEVSGARLAAFDIARVYVGILPQLALSPDGRYLSYANASGITVAALDPPRSTPIAPGGTAPVWHPPPRRWR